MKSSVRRRRALLVLVVGAFGVLAIFGVSQSPETIIPGDPAVFRVRVIAMLDGGLPYLDVPFEHLPLMAVPMFGAWFLGGSASQSVYVFSFAGLMLATLAATAAVVDAWGDRVGLVGAGWRWVLVTVPLMPLVLFRNDPLPVLLCVVALYLMVSERRSWVVVAMGGAASKIWPAVLSLAAWRKGRTTDAVIVALSGVAALAMTFLPGFSAARQGVGIHAETVVGALVGLWRSSTGDPSGLVLTTAAYLPVGGALIALNAILGLAVLSVAVWVLKRSHGWRASFLALGTAVAGVILTSQLFSLQYVLWLTPFLAVSRRSRILITGAALGLLTTVLAWNWQPSLFEDPTFYSMLTLRNGAVLVIAWWLAVESRRTSESCAVG